MGDIASPTLLWIKGFLFLLLGILGAVLLLLHAPSLTAAFLLCLSVWAFCRFYYFAFYVIEHYIDSTYRFSGLLSFLRYAVSRRRTPEENAGPVIHDREKGQDAARCLDQPSRSNDSNAS